MNIEMPDYNRVYALCNDVSDREKLATEEWNKLTDHLGQQGLLSELRVPLIDRLVREYVEYEMAYPEVAAKGPTFTGPNGGEVYSLAWSALAKTKTEIAKLEDALKITPQKVPAIKPPPKKMTAADRYLDPEGWAKYQAELENDECQQ